MRRYPPPTPCDRPSRCVVVQQREQRHVPLRREAGFRLCEDKQHLLTGIDPAVSNDSTPSRGFARLPCATRPWLAWQPPRARDYLGEPVGAQEQALGRAPSADRHFNRVGDGRALALVLDLGVTAAIAGLDAAM